MDRTKDNGSADGEKVTSSVIDDVIVAVATATNGWEDVPNGRHVQTLDETNFYETIGGNRCVLVFFYAKWCSVCTPFRTVFADVASTMSGNCCVAAAVDCTRDFTLAVTCSVRSVPEFVAFTSQGRHATTYDGDRSADDLRRFVCRTLQAVVDDDHDKKEPTHGKKGKKAGRDPKGPKAPVGRGRKGPKKPHNPIEKKK